MSFNTLNIAEILKPQLRGLHYEKAINPVTTLTLFLKTINSYRF